MSTFEGLGRALRWLRDRQGKRQYHVADAAGITKAMLSAYETGKQKPSLDTLEKILEALDCNLNDLHNALQIVNERPEAIRRPSAGRPATWESYDPSDGSSGDLYRVLGVGKTLPAGEEQALGEMLHGFHRLLRHLYEAVARLAPPRDSEPGELG